jgi:hypothetical protein
VPGVALDEEFEVGLGESSAVQVSAVRERRRARRGKVNRVQIRNARDSSVRFELRLRLSDGTRVVDANHPLGTRNGQPLFQLTIPARSEQTLRYRTERTSHAQVTSDSR